MQIKELELNVALLIEVQVKSDGVRGHSLEGFCEGIVIVYAHVKQAVAKPDLWREFE